MSILIDDCSAALVASPRLRLSLVGERRYANDAQPRLLSRPTTPPAAMAWRHATGSTMRGFAPAAQQLAQDGRTGSTAGAYVAANKHFSIRSGPPTRRP